MHPGTRFRHKKLADYLEMIGADYLNLNEFEMGESNQLELQKRGFEIKSDSIASVKNSTEYADRFLKEFGTGRDLNVHFCTASLKDGVQLRNRYRRRANNIKKDWEQVSEDGTLLFMRIQGSIQSIREIKDVLINESGVPPQKIKIKETQGYLYLPAFLAEEVSFVQLIKQFPVKMGIVEILPFHEKECYQEVEYIPIID